MLLRELREGSGQLCLSNSFPKRLHTPWLVSCHKRLHTPWLVSCHLCLGLRRWSMHYENSGTVILCFYLITLGRMIRDTNALGNLLNTSIRQCALPPCDRDHVLNVWPFRGPHGPDLTHTSGSLRQRHKEKLFRKKKSEQKRKNHEDAEAAAARHSGWWNSSSQGRWQRTSNIHSARHKVEDDDVNIENELWATYKTQINMDLSK